MGHLQMKIIPLHFAIHIEDHELDSALGVLESVTRTFAGMWNSSVVDPELGWEGGGRRFKKKFYP